MGFDELISDLNNAFFRVESFMNGKLIDYQYFGFNKAFTNLFNEIRKPQNLTYNNCKLIGFYWDLLQQISIHYDNGDYDNIGVNENSMFVKDIDEIIFLTFERIEDFYKFTTNDEEDRKISINDIIKTKQTPNPEPKTPFTDPKTHELFNYIVDNWSYNKGQKWADIWNVLRFSNNYKAPYQNEYQKYIIQRFGYTGKFQYDKQKRDGNRDKQSLLELIENFSKK